LQAGPFAERPKFDPKAAAAAKIGDIDISQVGKGEQLPWEANGAGWHSRDRVTTTGKAPTWDGDALVWVERQVQAFGGFSPTNWNHRSVVEVAAATKSHGWFLHAMTGHEGYLKLVFRVARNAFKQAGLEARLALKRLSDYPGLEHYARDRRVEVSQSTGPWQQVVVTAVKKSEIDTPTFRAFLKEAAASFQNVIGRLGTAVEDVMPWKLNGEKWHLSDKGFPPGKGRKWDPNLLARLLELFRAVEPEIDVKWDVRDSVTLRVPGIGRMWARLKTKEPGALECWFVGKPGQFNLSRVEGFGVHPEIVSDRADRADVLKLRFVTAGQLKPAELKKLLAEHLAGFRERFAGEGEVAEAG
jgi:excinuclease ABC subunit A